MRGDKAAQEIYGTYRGSLLENVEGPSAVPRWDQLTAAERVAWIHAWLHAEDLVISEQQDRRK
jgi:hypothetical protein